MQSNNNTIVANVNSSKAKKIPGIWERDFQDHITALGKANHVFINVRKELQAVLGRKSDYVWAVIELARRFNSSSFHCSHEEFLEFAPVFSVATLKRRKVECAEFVTIKHGVKNRTWYHINVSWFANFINGLLSKLAVQQAQNEPSHIVSNDHKIIDDHIFKNNIDFEILQEYENENRKIENQNRKIIPPKPQDEKPLTDKQITKRIDQNVPDTAIRPQILWFVKNYDQDKYKSYRHALHVALMLYRNGKWSKPKGMNAEESRNLEAAAKQEKEQSLLASINNPLLADIRKSFKRVNG